MDLHILLLIRHTILRIAKRLIATACRNQSLTEKALLHTYLHDLNNKSGQRLKWQNKQHRVTNKDFKRRPPSIEYRNTTSFVKINLF